MLDRLCRFRSTLLLLSMAAGCASPAMMNSEQYARQHRGEGTRRVLAATPKELREGLRQGWEQSNGEVYVAEEDDEHMLAKAKSVNFTYAVYFRPGPAAGQTEVEMLMASRWLKASLLREHEAKLLDHMEKGIEEKRRNKTAAPAPAAAAASAAPSGETAPEPAAAKPLIEAPRPAPKPSKELDSQL